LLWLAIAAGKRARRPRQRSALSSQGAISETSKPAPMQRIPRRQHVVFVGTMTPLDALTVLPAAVCDAARVDRFVARG
jgi:hypothetical protein